MFLSESVLCEEDGVSVLRLGAQDEEIVSVLSLPGCWLFEHSVLQKRKVKEEMYNN